MLFSVVGSENLYRLVGERVQRLRKRADLTQEGLAARVSMTRTSITNLEKGRQKLPLHQLLHVAEALDVDLKDLIPSREELGSAKTIKIRVGDTEADVLPRTARMIQQIVQGRKR